jgi:hypothetical protein
LKIKWCDIILKDLSDKGFKGIDKKSFPPLMKQVVEKGFLKKTVIQAFEECGMYPLNRQKIIIRSKKAIVDGTGCLVVKPAVAATSSVVAKVTQGAVSNSDKEKDGDNSNLNEKEGDTTEEAKDNAEAAKPTIKKRCRCRPTLNLDANDVLKVFEEIMTKTVKSACLEMTTAIVKLVEQKSHGAAKQFKRSLDTLTETAINQNVQQNVNKLRRTLLLSDNNTLSIEGGSIENNNNNNNSNCSSSFQNPPINLPIHHIHLDTLNEQITQILPHNLHVQQNGGLPVVQHMQQHQSNHQQWNHSQIWN